MHDAVTDVTQNDPDEDRPYAHLSTLELVAEMDRVTGRIERRVAARREAAAPLLPHTHTEPPGRCWYCERDAGRRLQQERRHVAGM